METSVSVDKSSKILKEKLAGRQTTPNFCCRGLAAVAQITPWCGKTSATLPHTVPLLHCIMESDIHIFYVRDFCCCHCCFCIASILHVWIHIMRLLHHEEQLQVGVSREVTPMLKLFRDNFKVSFKHFFCPPTERLPSQDSPGSSCFDRQSSGILVTCPAHLT